MAEELIGNGANEVFCSAVTSWEISRNYEMGKLTLPSPPEIWLAQQREVNRFSLLSIEELDLIHSSRLPQHHRDPADRILIAQASLNGFTLLSPDPMFHHYAIRLLW